MLAPTALWRPDKRRGIFDSRGVLVSAVVIQLTVAILLVGSLGVYGYLPDLLIIRTLTSAVLSILRRQSPPGCGTSSRGSADRLIYEQR
ncbi:hypothetical protein [Sporomusa aerivorans]|uniref:hypothetical protein n=1 Tax=Sporomusa aerivorans TaxID=204936 RepID=UPI00352B634B